MKSENKFMIKNILEDVLGAGDTNVVYLFIFYDGT